MLVAEENFLFCCEKKIEEIVTAKGKRAIYLWGCGHGGKLAVDFFRKKGVQITGCVDQKVDDGMKFFCDIPVLSPSLVNKDKHYMIGFISKNRHGVSDIQIISEADFSINQYKDLGYCNVIQDY